MDFQRDHLTVKINTLAAEARIIRRKERSLKKRGPLAGMTLQRFTSLQNHRKTIVRRETRHSLLAYAYLRGCPYHVVEQTCDEKPDWSLVARNVSRFSENPNKAEVTRQVKAWGERVFIPSEPALAAPELAMPVNAAL